MSLGRGLAAVLTLGLTGSLLVPALSIPAAGADDFQIVVHTPLTASNSELVTVTPDAGDAVSAEHAYEDSYGSFAVMTIAGGTATGTFEAGHLASDTAYDFAGGHEVWLSTDGTPSSSRFQAQGCALVLHYRADSADAAGKSTVSFTVDGGSALDGPAPTVDGTTATFLLEAGDACTAKRIVVSPAVSGKATGESFAVNVKSFGEAWIANGWAAARTSEAWADNFAVIHYRRSDESYSGWGVHSWVGTAGGYSGNSISWGSPLMPNKALEDNWGITFQIPIQPDSETVPYIVHKGDTKDPSNKDQFLDLAATGGEVWLESGNANDDGYSVYTTPIPSSLDADLTHAKAIWLTKDTIAWPYEMVDNKAYLFAAPDGGITVDENGVKGQSNAFELTYSPGLVKSIRDTFPAYSSYKALKLPAEALAKANSLLRGQLVIMMTEADGVTPKTATGVQIGAALDAYYPKATDVKFGPTWKSGVPTVSVWAPTAQNVSLELFDDATTEYATEVPMKRDPITGAWSVTGNAGWKNKFYLFKVEVFVPSSGGVRANWVSDPYSLSLSTNGQRSQLVDLSDAALKPAGWDKLSKPKLGSTSDATVYEMMVRDFSVFDTTVAENYRGGFMGFANAKSAGMKHLTELAKAGLTHLQIGPAFDIASVNEDKSTWSTPDYNALKSYAPDSTQQKAAVQAVQNSDGQNWGYDPVHFTAPDGSFATDANGSKRVLEFRSMVKGLSGIGLRTVMDVVYNHTNASGQSDNSTFDKIVPGYYYRLLNDGSVATSTCCQNTATERTMMAKFVRDSLLTWAVDYKVDGFRFDLMGHMPRQLMVDIRKDMDKLTLAKNGVDGKKILLYGEGWNFGEVSNNAYFVQATQGNLRGTGVGAFDDRIRDAIRGGGPFDSDPRKQGFGSGLFGELNGSGLGNNLTNTMDLVKTGMTGEVSSFEFTTGSGIVMTGAGVSYNGAAAAFAGNPNEAVVYVDAHDNETLYDALVYKLPDSTTMADRIRHQVLSLAMPTLSQGMPFVLAGSDLLRSKSLDKNSYNSGDWFNGIDWTLSTNGFGRGLPPEVTNYDQAKSKLAKTALVPTAAQMTQTSKMWQDFLKIRYSSPLFRLKTAADVKKRLSFLTGGPSAKGGLLVERIVDTGKGITGIDSKAVSVIIVANATDSTLSYTSSALKKATVALSTIQQKGADSVVKKATFKAGKFTVPALTVAVFVQTK